MSRIAKQTFDCFFCTYLNDCVCKSNKNDTLEVK